MMILPLAEVRTNQFGYAFYDKDEFNEFLSLKNRDRMLWHGEVIEKVIVKGADVTEDFMKIAMQELA